MGSSQTKKEYFRIWNDNIKQIEDCIEDNKGAIIDLKNKNVNNYVESELQKWFYKKDIVKLLNEEYDYYNKIIAQIHSNDVMFKQGKTKNMMDYDNNKVTYLSNQIRIMRSDMQNYIDVIEVKPKQKPKSKKK
ncbi:hypothetical protein ACFFLS_11315 [Flavobacterium procerum]|uniref:Uncharacterized protein n=1 Tax=Flavobacterium procerum TaxID=1455569 RepID=A0ABV6BQ94_9FLAO